MLHSPSFAMDGPPVPLIKRAKTNPQLVKANLLPSQEGKIVIQTKPTPPQIHQPSAQHIQQKTIIIQRRFKLALKKNDASMLVRCLESGYVPTLQQWTAIIGKMHVNSAIQCIRAAGTNTFEAPCIVAAIRRQHRKLFKEVMTRVDIVPRHQMESLMAVPAYYLEVCLNKGLDPNIPLKNKRLPLEHACAHSRIAHIEILLKDTRTAVSQNVCRFMIRQNKQQKFAPRAIELCDDIVPNMILEAIVANVTSALTSIMAKLEDKYEENPKWDDITHMLRCPISQDYSTDLVKTPVNDHYYDRVQLLTWVKSKGTDPLTRAPLQESDLLLRSEFLSEYARILQAKIQELENISNE